MISASKSTSSLNNLKILRPKVMKNLTNLHDNFCESPPRCHFINVKHTNLLYERRFGSFYYVHVTRKKADETTFVRKLRTFNVDEIDVRSSKLGMDVERKTKCLEIPASHDFPYHFVFLSKAPALSASSLLSSEFGFPLSFFPLTI